MFPGFKEIGGTSEEAAKAIAERAPTLRAQALHLLRQTYPMGLTADEVARSLGETPFAMRPRVTELFNSGLVQKGPDRRINRSGRQAWVWYSYSPLA